MKIWKFSTCDECEKKIECGIQFKVKGQSFGGVVLCVDCIKSAQQMLAVDVAECVCENRHIGEDCICENCGGVA